MDDKVALSAHELDDQLCHVLAPRRLMGSIGNVNFGNLNVVSAAVNLTGSQNRTVSIGGILVFIGAIN